MPCLPGRALLPYRGMDLQGKKVVVTGGAGFVGSHLVGHLVEREADVVVLDNFSRGINYVPGAVYHRIDAGLVAPCKTHFRDAAIVFNLAALVAGVIYNQSHHTQMYHENMRLQSAPVVAAAAVGVERFVQMSSVCIYGEKYNHPAVDEFAYNELGSPVTANEGYSWSKRMGERVAAWSGIPYVAIARPSNIFGPHDYFDERAHVIPALIRKAHQDDEVVLHGSGEEQREFIYVTDVARGLIAAATNTPEGVGVYNIGAGLGNCVSISELAEIIVSVSGEEKPIRTTPEKDGGDSIRFSMVDKAKDVLGWEAKVGLLEGIQRTVEWWR